MIHSLLYWVVVSIAAIVYVTACFWVLVLLWMAWHYRAFWKRVEAGVEFADLVEYRPCLVCGRTTAIRNCRFESHGNRSGSMCIGTHRRVAPRKERA